VPSVYLILSSLAFFNFLTLLVVVGTGRSPATNFYRYLDVSIELPSGNGNRRKVRKLKIARWEK